jgi:CRP-like cAMP-binding protein
MFGTSRHNRRSRRALDSLRELELFEECSDRELAKVMPLVTMVDVPPGRVLMRQGAAGAECFVIMHGDTKVERNGIITAEVGDGELVGELALIDHAPRTATVTTLAPTEVLVMSQREFSGLRHLGIASVSRRRDATADARRAALATRAW